MTSSKLSDVRVRKSRERLAVGRKLIWMMVEEKDEEIDEFDGTDECDAGSGGRGDGWG